MLHQFETLTYNVAEEKDILTDVNEKLREIYSNFYQRMPNKEGRALRPRDQCQAICDGEFGRQRLFLGVHHCHLRNARSRLHPLTETVLASKLTVYAKLVRWWVHCDKYSKSNKCYYGYLITTETTEHLTWYYNWGNTSITAKSRFVLTIHVQPLHMVLISANKNACYRN